MAKSNNGTYWVGFDLGGTKMLATVFDAKFKPVGSKRRKTKGQDGVKAGLARIAETIELAMAEAGVNKDQLGGIGVGCPGPLDLNQGIIFDTVNIGWKDVRIKDSLEKAFGCPTVIANDVDAGVYGESRFGAAKSARCVVGVFPGTGIGGGAIYDGQIIRGKVSSCMEIGHIQVVENGPLCGCGQRGCLESVASRLAIASAAAQAAYRGEAAHLREEVGTDLSNIKSGALARSVAAGDKAVEQIIRRAAAQIGTALAGIVHLLSPDVIVLGGGLVEAMPKIFTDEVTKAAGKRVMASYAKTFAIVAAKLGDDATTMGAAAWAQQYVADLDS